MILWKTTTHDDPNGEMLGCPVVPVEPCEHGKIDGHYNPQGYWCPGAGIGDNDATIEEYYEAVVDDERGDNDVVS